MVLLDLMMPMLSGVEALRQILAARPDARVLVISGYDEWDVMQRFADSRVAGFLQKPFTGGRLAQKIREVLMSRGAAPGRAAAP